MKKFTQLMVLALLAACAVGACARKSGEAAGGQATQLSCGNKTYRVSAERVDAEVNEACDRVRKSAEALEAYRATVARFTCQESNGHVVLSLLAPRDEFDEYDRNCRQYLTAQDALHNHTIDIAAHQAASRDFTASNNQLARRHAEADNALFRQRDADQAALSRLIKNRGGSIEITN
ncbi:MAG TPA: hypothetical protein VEH00_03250 [Steroidobacteraceae bacterium]|nr:hypothetical protein [Steroidobacteraceae bacterium]